MPACDYCGEKEAETITARPMASPDIEVLKQAVDLKRSALLGPLIGRIPVHIDYSPRICMECKTQLDLIEDLVDEMAGR